jgi:20S proteasome subunit alpha 5
MASVYGLHRDSRICHRGDQSASFCPTSVFIRYIYFQLGSTTVGIRTQHGVVLGVEKRVQSPLLEASSIEKIMEIDTHLGCAMSGLTADARTIVDHARVTAQNHAFTYDERIKVESVTQAVCDLALRFGESVHDEDAMMSRPFGVALLIAGVDELGPQLCVPLPSPPLCPAS